LHWQAAATATAATAAAAATGAAAIGIGAACMFTIAGALPCALIVILKSFLSIDTSLTPDLATNLMSSCISLISISIILNLFLKTI
jgi:hypothetical protein